ncbi:hypothetical protein FC093_23530 [Ilyomonas limi]|jgi:transposase-like protein|uniref:Transposase n=1 Tax=Ilyomonas limi TaxID=2575867 RepID=A0A4U3KPC5_9BACT|nr:helix-turn-helix domain-containing protein [Ilyomonas limi]TKK63972.1 hypothetical protein FC093_23530 [Ilyomonas limi]
MSKEVEQFSVRPNRLSRYDKRLILKVVAEVEAGLPRKEATRIYQLGKTSLDSWLKKYGSPNYQQHLKRKSYSNLQKRTIVAAIEQGRMNLSEAQRAYNVKDQKTIRGWLEKYKSEKIELCTVTQPSMGKIKKTATNVSNEALQKALKEAERKLKALNTLIDVAEEQLKIDIRKKSGARQS